MDALGRPPRARACRGRFVPGAAALWQSLKYYFAVNNKYVVRKAKIIMFPFKKTDWRRLPAAGGIHDVRARAVHAGCCLGV